MTELAGRPRRHRHDGPQPRSRPQLHRRRRPGRRSPTPPATSTAWPGDATVRRHASSELIEHRHRLLAVVAVPTAFHLEAGLELAAAGVHTLIEKPLATDTAESAEARRGLRGRRPGQRGRPHRALQPGAAVAARSARGRRPRRRSTRSPLAARARSPTASPTSAW